MKKHLALITYSGLPHGAESERLMLPYLAAANVETEIVDWRSGGTDFSKFDLIVLRSCWDYHLKVAEFIDVMGWKAVGNKLVDKKTVEMEWEIKEEDKAQQGELFG